MFRSRLLVVCFAGWLSGCAARVAPVAPPPPPPPAPIATPAPVIVEAPKPTPQVVDDRISLVIKRAEAAFDLGRAEFDKGRLVSAREHFDAAIDLLLRLPEGARGD